MHTKDTVREVLDRLPDDCTLDDVLFHLYVVQQVERGIADANGGHVILHEDVAVRLRQKWSIGADG